MSVKDREYEERGLMRLGKVAALLDVDLEVVRRYVKAGLIRSETFDSSGKRNRGIPLAEVDRLVAALTTGRAL